MLKSFSVLSRLSFLRTEIPDGSQELIPDSCNNKIRQCGCVIRIESPLIKHYRCLSLMLKCAF